MSCDVVSRKADPPWLYPDVSILCARPGERRCSLRPSAARCTAMSKKIVAGVLVTALVLAVVATVMRVFIS
jgi:hypothetical protein